jgi:hypothetical protein
MSLLTHVRLPVEIESVMNMQKTHKSKINNKSSAKEKKRLRVFVRAKIEASLFNSFDRASAIIVCLLQTTTNGIPRARGIRRK